MQRQTGGPDLVGPACNTLICAAMAGTAKTSLSECWKAVEAGATTILGRAAISTLSSLRCASEKWMYQWGAWSVLGIGPVHLHPAGLRRRTRSGSADSGIQPARAVFTQPSSCSPSEVGDRLPRLPAPTMPHQDQPLPAKRNSMNWSFTNPGPATTRHLTTSQSTCCSTAWQMAREEGVVQGETWALPRLHNVEGACTPLIPQHTRSKGTHLAPARPPGTW